MTIQEAIKQNKGFANEQEKALVNLLFTYGVVANVLHDNLKPHGISMQQFNVLRILRGQNKKPCPLYDIKSRMLDKQSDVSRIVDRLVEKGLANRTGCPNDRRRVDITIADAGLHMLSIIDAEHRREELIMTALSEEEATLMNALLDKIRMGLQARALKQ